MAEGAPTMMVEHPAPHRERAPIGHLLFGIFIGPVAWGLHLYANSAIAGQACFPGAEPRLAGAPNSDTLRLMLASSGGAAMLLGLIGAFFSYRLWRITRREQEGSHHDLMDAGEGRTRFLASIGVLVGLGFALVTLFDTLPLLMVPVCGK
ncbi:MAG: hypothetical protein NVSMB26_18570 [Beijerinckiaceae bacterium]